jgi:GNAT superfamily N-acetyltransferase
MHELRPDEYSQALPLIGAEQPTYFPIVARALAEGNTPGELWVDAVDKPTSAFMWDEDVICGLAGDPDNGPFNDAVAHLITERIMPHNLARGKGWLKVYYTSEAWEEQAAALFAGATIRKVDRRLYAMRWLKVADWQSRVPTGFEVRRMDAALLRAGGLGNLARVVEEIGCCWPSVEHFLANGFGFCMLGEGRIVCWCTGEYASGHDIGIGIATDPGYQGRGFATLTAAAFVQHCIANNLTAYWDARADNLPSLAVAEKVGFERVSDYRVLIVAY